ncbi:MAG TPA: radical SAM protein, partial [Polyangiales bacterium]
GLHVLSCPDECAPHADALALGDGVTLWPRILEDVERGALKQRYQSSFQTAYADDPAPRRALLPRAGFLTTSSVNATRGCHNRCEFCYLSTDGLRMPYRMRDPAQIVRELDADDQPYAVFTDNNLGSNREYLRKLSRALAPRDKIWSAAVSIDVTDDPTLIREMALGGCVGVFIGFESLNDDNLAQARKRTPRTEDYARRVRLFHDHGIQVNGSFVLGFDNDRRDAFAQLAEWVEDTRLESATFHILTPYPGTPLFRKLAAAGRILHRDWSRYDTSHAVFQPAHMRPDELERGYAWLYQRVFSHASIWRRRPEDARAVPAYLAMSYLYKRNNALWRFLIERGLTHRVWHPLVSWSARRHRDVRARIRERGEAETPAAVRALNVVYPSV